MATNRRSQIAVQVRPEAEHKTRGEQSMSIPIPEYISDARLQTVEIHYLWDEWNLENTVGTFDEDVYQQLKAMSLRAAFAVLLGAAEWVLYRLDPLLEDDTLPSQAIEAGWAQVVDPRYAVPWNPFEDWQGPIQGPVRRTCMLMADAADYLGQRVEVARPAAKVLKVAAHILPTTRSYKSWEGSALRRLRDLFPWTDRDPLGDPVPRQALDPNFDFQSHQLQEIVQTYLSQLDFNEHAFLSTPDQMLSWGFEGTPYTFDLNEDRERRNG